MLADPEIVDLADDDHRLTGRPATGPVTGPARPVHVPAAALIEPGDILVAPTSDPGWTPIFLALGGPLTEPGLQSRTRRRWPGVVIIEGDHRA